MAAWALDAATQVGEAGLLEGDPLEPDRAPVAGRGLRGEAERRLPVRVEHEVADEAPASAVCGRWKAYAAPIRAIRRQTELPSTTKELQSSETPLVTTETTIGSLLGEYSKHSFAQRSSRAYRTSTPAS